MKATIGHIILNISHYDTAVLFYDTLMEALGFVGNYVHKTDSNIMKSYRQGEHNLWIRYAYHEDSQPFVRNVGLDHLAFEVPTNADVDVLYQLVQTLNVLITRPPRLYPEYSPTYYAFFFRDPDGLPLEIYVH